MKIDNWKAFMNSLLTKYPDLILIESGYDFACIIESPHSETVFNFLYSPDNLNVSINLGGNGANNPEFADQLDFSKENLEYLTSYTKEVIENGWYILDYRLDLFGGILFQQIPFIFGKKETIYIKSTLFSFINFITLGLFARSIKTEFKPMIKKS